MISLLVLEMQEMYFFKPIILPNYEYIKQEILKLDEVQLVQLQKVLSK